MAGFGCVVMSPDCLMAGFGCLAMSPDCLRRLLACDRAAGCGAVYPTATKDSSCIGLAGLRAVCDAAAPTTPVVGIGGITLANAAPVVAEGGAAGVAVVSALFDETDVEGATAQLAEAVWAVKAAELSGCFGSMFGAREDDQDD